MLTELNHEKILDGNRMEHDEFDVCSGNPLELLLFNNRAVILVICAVLTCVLGWSAAKIAINADYLSTLPESQQFVRNYVANRGDLRTLGDSVQIVVENKEGDIYDPNYLEILRRLNDSVFLMPGVDRSFVKSLWMPVVRWTEITEQGASGGPVMPDDYDGSAASLDQLRQNIGRAGIIGSLVANDQKSSVIFVPLLDRIPATGKPFNYGEFWRGLQGEINSVKTPTVEVRVVGFAAIMGTLIADLREFIFFFLAAVATAAIFIFLFTRCIRSTIAILTCSFIAVIWLVGTIHLFGYGLDPYSILVPFLVFAIGVSHGTQKMNGIMQDIGRGAHKYIAARLTFRRLFLAGFTALIADAVGFSVLTVIDIRAIRMLAITASVGVTMLVFTNLVLLPVILSYIGVSRVSAARSLAAEKQLYSGGIFESIFLFLEKFCERGWALSAIATGIVLIVIGLLVGSHVQIGDVKQGAPEFRSGSVYNESDAYVKLHYSLSSDQYAIIVRTPSGGLNDFRAVIEMDRLEQYLRKVPGVQTTISPADLVRNYTADSFEGNLKWWTINRDSYVLGGALNAVFAANPELINNDYSVAPVVAYLVDHKAETLTGVTQAAEKFAKDNGTDNEQFLLAAGSAGMDAATNMVVQRASVLLPYLVYSAVTILCFISFRSWRAVVVALVPLVITSMLCQGLMVVLGIGVKVATLPVMALGVGIGVDYALYLLSVQLSFQRGGDSLRIAYRKALRFTGRIVALVGFTLASGVSLWVFSPIKFQADMGALLTFMFLWNMLGALILIPALSSVLLQTKWVKKRKNADG